jgi:hypothetical protein
MIAVRDCRVLVVAFTLAAPKVWNWMRGECVTTVTNRLPSPDGSWVVFVQEDVCDLGLLPSSTAWAGVHLVTTTPPLRDIDLLGVDTTGEVDGRPVAVWSAPNILRVTVPLRSQLTITTTQVDGIHVDVHFDPDAPRPERFTSRRERVGSRS